MKKIVLLLLILFSLNFKVQASAKDVYYSEYSDFSEFSQTKIDSSELVDVEIERRYKWYKENITDEYLLYDDGMEKYEFINTDNFIESDFSEWGYEKPDKTTGRVIEEKEEYKVKRLKPIQSLMLGDFYFSKDKVTLGEIEIYVNNNKIDYTSVCGSCYNGVFDESSFVLIDFYEPYYIKDITIKLITAENQYINSFRMFAIEPMIDNVPSKIFASYIYNNELSDIVITEEDFNIVNPEYEEEIIYDLLPNVSRLDNVEVNMKYRYKDKYYYFYNTELEYLNGYYSEYPGYKKDENDYMDYYRYRTRDKIVIDNEMTITRYKKDLNDFIISTTDYEIESNINYLKNGVYSVRYVTPFQTIEKEVTVDIEENELREELENLNQKYNELVVDYNNNQDKIEELTESIEVKNEQIDNLKEKQQIELSSNDTEYEELTNENKQCSMKLANMILRNEDNEKKLKLSNQANEYLEKTMLDIKNESINVEKKDIISFVLLGFLLVTLIIFIIKKMSTKNKF